MIFIILLFLPLFAHAQTEGSGTEEVVIYPEFIYGISSIFIKASEDANFQYSILDLDKNNTFLSGKVNSLEPLVRTGKYTFYTPTGKPYASGYYSNNIPFRVWSFFDSEGQVVASVNYSNAIQYMNNFGDIDIGEDFVQQAQKAPKFGKRGLKEFLSFIEENAIYPPFTLINNMEGKVVCQFVIDKTGQLINARIVEGLNEDFDLEVIRVLALSPKWKPGTDHGKPVNVMISIPVHFKLNSEAE
ncbi:MAG: energy transducer TonB [Bacteroidales bacterium]